MLNFISRASQFYELRKASDLAARGQFDEAQNIAKYLLEKDKDSFVYKLFLADTFLFLGDLREAADEYKNVKLYIESSETLERKDKIFLLAYIDFRLKAILDKLGELNFKGWRSASKTINALPASKLLKDVFGLPTK